MRASLYILGIISVVISGLSARADVPPPPDYVENCTIDKTCPYRKECVVCDANYEDYSRSTPICEEVYAPLKYAKECQSRGASVWQEIWCRPKSDSTNQQSTQQNTEVDAESNSASLDANQVATPITCPNSESNPDNESKSESSCSVGMVPFDGDDGKGDERYLTLFAALFITILGRRRRIASNK